MLLLDERCSPLQIHDLQYDLSGEIDNSIEEKNITVQWEVQCKDNKSTIL